MDNSSRVRSTDQLCHVDILTCKTHYQLKYRNVFLKGYFLIATGRLYNPIYYLCNCNIKSIGIVITVGLGVSLNLRFEMRSLQNKKVS